MLHSMLILYLFISQYLHIYRVPHCFDGEIVGETDKNHQQLTSRLEVSLYKYDSLVKQRVLRFSDDREGLSCAWANSSGAR